MAEFQLYYLDGPKAGEIETSEFRPREGISSKTMIGSSNQPPRQSGNQPTYFKYLITRQEGTYCVVSTMSHLDSDLAALEEAKKAGLRPF